MAKSSTERVRRHRKRKNRGVKAIVRVEVADCVVRRLIGDGWLSAEDGDEVRVTREAIGNAISEMLDDWAA